MADHAVPSQDFAAGARLALTLLRDARQLDEELGIGEGPQRLQGRRLLGPVLAQLAARPDLVDGFDAVLTDVLQAATNDCGPDWQAYQRAATGLRLVGG